jgi:membrane protease YdiL (CAAX protease family)
MAAIKLTAALVHRAATGAWPRFGETPVLLMFVAILGSAWVQAGEEIGWRGYALPRLAKRTGAAAASLIVGAIWAAWHLPLFFMEYTDTVGQSFPVYVSSVVAVSVAMAWLFWKSGGSLLLVMVMHAAINNTSGIVPSAVPGASDPLGFNASPVGWITAALAWILALPLLVRLRRASLDA